jgi:hypothetical protein
MRTGTDLEPQQGVRFGPFAKPSRNGGFLRIADDHGDISDGRNPPIAVEPKQTGVDPKRSSVDLVG